jgi:hypothetical protein
MYVHMYVYMWYICACIYVYVCNYIIYIGKHKEHDPDSPCLFICSKTSRKPLWCSTVLVTRPRVRWVQCKLYMTCTHTFTYKYMCTYVVRQDRQETVCDIYVDMWLTTHTQHRYSMCEMLKDGMWNNTKYVPCVVQHKPKHMIVFSNEKVWPCTHTHTHLYLHTQ